MTDDVCMQLEILTIFPKMFNALHYGIPGRAIEDGLVQLNCHALHTFSNNKHQRIDDKSYGGGPGMVIQGEPLVAALKAARNNLGKRAAPVIYLSPQGTRLDQSAISTLAKRSAMILICGRYEGIDQRFIDQFVDEEWSCGDYVLSGGELPAMLLIDSMIRLLPQALGNNKSKEQDSFMHGLLDHPHYTRPEFFSGQMVPNVLLSGNHEKIARWREKQALGNTWKNRADLLEKLSLTTRQQALLDEYIEEYFSRETD